jgi:hypothetical protein
MRPLTRTLLCLGALVLGLSTGPAHPSPPTTLAQPGWAAEPTYRFAGHYEGDWTADLTLDPSAPPGGWQTVLEQRGGELRGTVALDVACDGAVSGQAQGQSQTPTAFAAIADGPGGPRVLSATLDLGAEGGFTGSLAGHAADGAASRVQAALAGALRDLPSDLETAAAPLAVERYYTGAGTIGWDLQEGTPARLAGSLAANFALAAPDGAGEAPPALRAAGRWVAARTAVALCPWQATVAVSGAVANEQLHDERLQLTFAATPDGRIEGTGRGQATIRGGPPGGCTYSGGGPIAALVGGEARDGRFRLRLEDFDQPQLLVTTTCATGRFVGPQAPLSTRFGTIELPELVGAQAHLTLPPTVPDAWGTLDVTIAPVVGGTPP